MTTPRCQHHRPIDECAECSPPDNRLAEITEASLRARLAAAQAREARLVGALTDLLGHWDAFTDRGMSWGNQERAYYCLAKGAQASWSNARTALTADGAALAAAIEGVLDGQPRDHHNALAALRLAWRGA